MFELRSLEAVATLMGLIAEVTGEVYPCAIAFSKSFSIDTSIAGVSRFFLSSKALD